MVTLGEQEEVEAEALGDQVGRYVEVRSIYNILPFIIQIKSVR